jgi:hypothetical protein
VSDGQSMRWKARVMCMCTKGCPWQPVTTMLSYQRGTPKRCAVVSQVAQSTQEMAYLGTVTCRPMDTVAMRSHWNAGVDTLGCLGRMTSSWKPIKGPLQGGGKKERA